jgi:hypothetical protein
MVVTSLFSVNPEKFVVVIFVLFTFSVVITVFYILLYLCPYFMFEDGIHVVMLFMLFFMCLLSCV